LGAQGLVEVGVVVVDAGDEGEGVGDVPLGEAVVEILGEFSASVVVVVGAGGGRGWRGGCGGSFEGSPFDFSGV